MAAVLLPSKHLKGIDHAPKAYPFESHKTGGGHFVRNRWVNTQPETGKTFQKFAKDASYDPDYIPSFNPPRHSEVERQMHIIKDWKGGGSLFPSGQKGGGALYPSGQHGKGALRGAFLGSDGLVHHGSNVSTGGGIRKKRSRKRGGSAIGPRPFQYPKIGQPIPLNQLSPLDRARISNFQMMQNC